MSWKPELEEIARRVERAKEMGGAERVRRAKDAGRLSVRERIDGILDEDSFHETGALAGRVEYGDDGEITMALANFMEAGRSRHTGNNCRQVDSNQKLIGLSGRHQRTDHVIRHRNPAATIDVSQLNLRI